MSTAVRELGSGENALFAAYPFADFPGGSDSEESACNAGDTGSIPGSGIPAGGGHGNPLWYSCPENLMDREPGGLQSMGGNLMDREPGGLQSVGGTLMDREPGGLVRGVAKSRTRLSNTHTHPCVPFKCCIICECWLIKNFKGPP